MSEFMSVTRQEETYPEMGRSILLSYNRDPAHKERGLSLDSEVRGLAPVLIVCQSDCLDERALSGQALPDPWAGQCVDVGTMDTWRWAACQGPQQHPGRMPPYSWHSANCLDHVAFLETQGRRPGQPPPLKALAS